MECEPLPQRERKERIGDKPAESPLTKGTPMEVMPEELKNHE